MTNALDSGQVLEVQQVVKEVLDEQPFREKQRAVLDKKFEPVDEMKEDIIIIKNTLSNLSKISLIISPLVTALIILGVQYFITKL